MPDFPKPVVAVDYDAVASAVWGYATRTLTRLTGTPRADLLGVDQDLATIGYTSDRASKLDFLDVAVSTRSSHTVTDIWTYTTRTLTSLAGQPRIDLLGEDASFEAGTGARKARIDRLGLMEAHRTPTEGTATFATTDSYPKTVTIIDTSTMDIAGKQHLVDGFVDLSALASGESIVVREYMTIKSGGSPIKYAEETYSGAQTIPLLHITTKPARYGLKVELYMASAPSANRSFDYQLFVKAVE